MFEHSDPWITTSCINEDVIKLLGNALHKDICGSDVPCLGFCSWNYISGISITNTIVTYDSLYNSSGDQQIMKEHTIISIPHEMRYSVINVT
jgi:hypothetical protein